MKSAQRWDLVGTRKPTSHRYNPMLYEINELIDPNFANSSKQIQMDTNPRF